MASSGCSVPLVRSCILRVRDVFFSYLIPADWRSRAYRAVSFSCVRSRRHWPWCFACLVDTHPSMYIDTQTFRRKGTGTNTYRCRYSLIHPGNYISTVSLCLSLSVCRNVCVHVDVCCMCHETETVEMSCAFLSLQTFSCLHVKEGR